MENEKLPIKFFAPREVDELRIEGNKNSEKPKWVLRGKELKQRADSLRLSLDSLETKFSMRKSSPVPFSFIVKLQSDATAKSKREDITNLFEQKSFGGVVGLTDTNKLIVALDSLEELKEVANRINDYEINDYAISCIEDFEEFVPYIVKGKKECNYKIKLVDYQNYEQNLAMRRRLEHTLNKEGIDYTKTDYSEEYYIYKLRNITEKSLDVLKKADIFNALFSIEPMPKYKVSLDCLKSDNNIPIKKPDDEKMYITIGILDNGIANIPHLSPWMEMDRWSPYPKTSINPTHGTFVSGIALYGDECEGKIWVDHKGLKIFDAAVFPDVTKEGLDEDELIANIKDVIRLYHEKVKIWNLSISITREVIDTKFSDFAIALDSIQDEYNVLICKSAGNCENFTVSRPKGRIHEGADSVRSLVVGSVAHKKGKYDYAEVNDPSPFSRVGPGPEYIIKPEVSHYGGNAGIDPKGRVVTSGVKSFSKEGELAQGVGTSFSTPRITALAAGLQQELNEDFDPLLLKALIIHSASYPEDMSVPITERTKQVGFGIPKSVPEIIYNSPYEATLILRDNLAKGDKIDIMEFPMPDCLIRDGFYTGQIIATLVYDPILDPSQGIEYCQSNLDVKFGSYDAKVERDTTKRHILNPVGRQGAQNLFLGNLFSKTKMKSKTGDFALRERLQIQYNDKYYPVKKYAIDLSELTDKKRLDYLTMDKKWFLFLQGVYRSHIEKIAQLESFQLSQEFCLILTIRDPLQKEKVYDEVSQKLDEYNFWHSNIKVSTDVNIPL
ncbi:S8 family peptidase [Blautia wexlerae]|uniref:S8 family peptidase n=1 Tax=Blautia wexlerae TaxID=418240 RepID=UPI002E337D9F|nr:S8 family peptidase [Blautia wexlerae]MED7665525.1 S8 family peptidase [Blautia wexlerae]MED7665588.1 S8 family peptidase [Blautia wexlerae]